MTPAHMDIVQNCVYCDCQKSCVCADVPKTSVAQIQTIFMY